MCEKVESKLNIFLAGDSTVQTYDEDKQGGWGEFLHLHLTDNVNVFNRAIGGRSSKTFVVEGRLEKLLAEMTMKDYLFIQMGHNDATKNRPERYTDPTTTYKEYLKMYIDGAREKKAIPILITPVARLHFTNDCFMNDFPECCQAMKEVANEENVQLINLMEKSLSLYQTIGYNETLKFFMASINETDFTHFTKKGANEISKLVAQEFKKINDEKKFGDEAFV
jgi:lysophospholipase L1-like esterase